MPALSNQRIAYFNGDYVPEDQVVISFRDRGFRLGDAAFDMTRTFNGTPFKLREHIDRFYRSLKYLQIDPGLSPDEMIGISEEVTRRNEHLRGDGDDYWIAQRVTRGIDGVDASEIDHEGPTVIVEATPLPFKKRARIYRDGVDLSVSSVRRTAPESLSPRAKTHNYLNLIMADLETKAANPDSWPMLLDVNGNLSEAMGCNVFLVRDGGLLTPREQFVLPGISRAMVMELAAELDISCEEKDLDVFDAMNADEIFLSSTSLCMCPVRSINGASIGKGAVPGPITDKLLKAYSESVGCDIVGQYLARLDS
ncbi:MAG: hypothetical protein GKS00_24080 [Alphaproteobacteria bacterium]|nr:hypothetical protein [Alphaproteobacteria bacterium]